MIKIINILFILLFSTIWFACDKDVSITEFRDEFGNYQSELKIEALLQQDQPGNSIVRIIRTSAITDNDMYNGIDDDNDGLIDEEDEVITGVQDTSATVKVINMNSGEETEFEYVAVADSLQRFDEDNNNLILIPYGGYKPKSTNFQIEEYADYKIEIVSKDFNKTVTGITTVYPAVQFIDTLYTFQDSMVTMHVDDEKEIFWKSDLDVTAYYVSYYELTWGAANEWIAEYLDSFLNTRDNDFTKKYNNASIGREVIFGVDYETVLKITIEALSPEYGRYVFSELPLKDPKRTNLRDKNGNPVMGCFGAIAAKNIYVIIEE